jgi:cell division protein FtsB
MEIEHLKQENESLKARIAGLSFNLQQADKQIVALQSELERYSKQIKDLEAQIKHLNMLGQTSQTNKNDSRYY